MKILDLKESRNDKTMRCNLKEADNLTKSDFIKKSRENATYKQMERLARFYGYKLSSAYWANYDGAVININPESGSYFSEYLPEIYPPDYSLSSDGNDWRVQTISYGSLDRVEFEEFVQANENAYKLVEALSKIDLKTLEHEPEWS